jgi:hypothetical protein
MQSQFLSYGLAVGQDLIRAILPVNHEWATTRKGFAI